MQRRVGVDEFDFVIALRVIIPLEISQINRRAARSEAYLPRYQLFTVAVKMLCCALHDGFA